jgi:hypothetical protein
VSEANGVLPGCEVLPPLDQASPSALAPARRAGGPKGQTDGRQAKGRFAAVNAFLDVAARNLELSQIGVWMVLWRDTKPDGLARTSTTDMARRLGISRRTVLRAIKALHNAGLLIVVRVGNLRHGPSVYRITPTRRR